MKRGLDLDRAAQRSCGAYAVKVISRLIPLAVLFVGTASLVGCTLTFPLAASVATPDRTRRPGDLDLTGSRVRVEMYSGRRYTGQYLHRSARKATVDPEHVARYIEAARSDSVLSDLPVPGDTVQLVFRDRNELPLEGPYLGVTSIIRPGVVVGQPPGMAHFVEARSLSQILRSDGRPVPVKSLYDAVAANRLPTLADPSQGVVTILTAVGPMELEARDIRRIRTPRKSLVAVAVILGFVIDSVLVYSAVKSFEDLGGGW